MLFISSSRLRRSMPSLLLILLGTGLFLVAFAVWIGSTMLIVPKRRALEERHLDVLAVPEKYGLHLEKHEVVTNSGLTLQSILATRSTLEGDAVKTKRMEARLEKAGITKSEKIRGTVFLLHGRGGLKENLLAVAERFVAADYRCVVYDARAHGQSEGTYCTFGKNEVIDFQDVLRFYRNLLKSRDEEIGQICAFGNSLGASVILQSLGPDSPLDVVIASAGFAELEEIIDRSMNRKFYSLCPDWLISLSLRFGGIRAGFSPSEIKPINTLALSTTPVFFAHGTLDEVIPVEHAKRLYAAAAEPKRFREIPSGYHYNILASGGDDLYQEMIEFCLDQI